jgi:hypothetical protein
VRWQLVDQGRGAGQATVVESDGEWAVVEATQPFPIGATLRGIEAETGTEYRVKVRGGKKLRDGCYRVEGRFVGMTREERERLLAALSGHAIPGAGQGSPAGEG